MNLIVSGGTLLGLEAGDAATWFTGVFTAAVFGFTLFAWRSERRRVRGLEERTVQLAAREDAGRVAVWAQPMNPSLRSRTGAATGDHPDGAWRIVVLNDSSFAITTWSVKGSVRPGNIGIGFSNKDLGTIAPRGGIILFKLDHVVVGGVASADVSISFDDPSGMRWERGQVGLRQL